jgi:Domain of unknown function (DUF6046)
MSLLTEAISESLSLAGLPGVSVSPIGTPVFSDLSVAPGSYSVNGKPVHYNGINVPNTLFVVNKRKRIIVTTINGATSDVLEYTGSASAEIQCTLRIYGLNLIYPVYDMHNIYLMLESNQPIQINSWYLNQLEIYYAVVTDYEIPQQTGNISDQQIKFTMRQIDPNLYPTLLNG